MGLLAMMQWCWVVSPDNVRFRQFVADRYDLKGFDEWDFCQGTPIENWDESAWLRASDRQLDGDPDDMLQTSLGIPVYSTRLRETLERAGIGGIQYLPIHVLHGDGSAIPGYCIANILNFVAALDLERSEYRLWGDERPDRKGEIYDLRRAVLRCSALDGYHIIRLKEYDVSIYVSGWFKQVFISNGFTGCSFNQKWVAVVDDVGASGASADAQLQLFGDEPV